MNDPVVARHFRRRRSWYRRRLRIQKTLVAAAMLLLLVAATWQNVARHLGLPTFHSSDIIRDSYWGRGDVRHKLASVAAQAGAATTWRMRPTYAYSVIPGGVRDLHELREVAARDYVVRRHYARFNYAHAELVRSREARLVYMSYRRGEAIFWTRKKVHLNAGELLLTDGVITARARCGNQISETPQPEVAADEPAEDTFDRPVAELAPPMPALPFRSTLVRPNLPVVSAVGPSPLFAANFNFPYISFGGGGSSGTCETPQQEQWENSHGIGDDEKHEKICKHKHGHPAIPEPSTLLLISSGLAGVLWRYRRTPRQ